ncbi:accessory gene regulator B family protein [Clostridium folliculivorans]|uniref:Putative AgrB-like protein n=1 Tax=Clostridium folliculivorans TaxID=2886038 RepID=A0A9W5Y4L7_9CLOT|nr:accessory gene regulator B family protein [Clostridium folliculivorans]GKU26563.1 putative AgrB-like protein [Clostridium folliculivorans]GKU29005.1 putative AgrB-like protein [Clostridium folliculivorans]
MEENLPNNMTILEKLAHNIAMKINKVIQKDGIELQKVKLGIEIFLINISKFILILLISIKLHLVIETTIITIALGAIRSKAFGLHAKNSIVCTITSLMLYVIGGYASNLIQPTKYIIFCIFIIINIALYMYAPADTEYHPLMGQTLRQSLKKKAVITGMILMTLALISTNYVITNLITLASIFEVLSILPITYKVLNRRYNNYEQYEKSNI